MQLDKEDVRVVAKARVVRSQGKKPTYWLGGALVLMLVGVSLYRVKPTYGIAIMGLALIGYFWYARKLSEKQRIASINLVREWEAEQK